MSNAHFAGLATIHPHRPTAELTAEHKANSERLNRIHPYYNAEILPRDLRREATELAERQPKIDAYRERGVAFDAAEVLNQDHWSE